MLSVTTFVFIATLLFGNAIGDHDDDHPELIYTAEPSSSIGIDAVTWNSDTSQLFYVVANSYAVYIVDDLSQASVEEGTYTVSQDTQFKDQGYSNVLPTASWSDGTTLYVSSIKDGTITYYNISNQTAYNQIEINYDGSNKANINGLCGDPRPGYEHIIYATDLGITIANFETYTDRAAIYQINLTSQDYEKIYDEAVDTFEIHPNDCRVSSEGFLFTVDTYVDLITGNITVYDLTGETITTNDGFTFFDIGTSGYGLTFGSDQYTIYFTSYGAWNDTELPGQLYQLSYELDGSGIPRMDDNGAVSIIDGLIEPAHLTYVEEYDWLIIPSEDFGYLYFIDLSPPTSAPTQAPIDDIFSSTEPGDDDDDDDTTDGAIKNVQNTWLVFASIMVLFGSFYLF